MGFIKHKNLIIGVFCAVLWTAMALLILVLVLSEVSVEESLRFFYKQHRLGGLISLAALINLPAFFLALRYKQDKFALGILIVSLLLVVLIALLKLNF